MMLPHRPVPVLGALSLFAAAALGASALDAQTYRVEGAPPPPAIGLGSAVAVGDGELFVGRPSMVQGFPMPSSDTAAVHVFRRTAQGWREAAAVRARDAAIGDAFGLSLAAAGSVLVVGAPQAAEGRGAVYVFERDASGAWTERAKLTVPAGAAGDGFGSSVAAAPGMVLAGAPGHQQGRGAVLAFARDATGAWVPRGVLTGTATTAGDRFGAALSMSADGALVGAPGVAGGQLFGPQAQLRPGRAFVFRRAADGTWREEARLAAADSTVRVFGAAVLLDGGEAFVSSPVADQGAGAVLRFTREGAGAWQQRERLTAGTVERPALFGTSLARSGADLLVGAPFSAQGAGAVHVLRGENGAWRETQKLTMQAPGMGTQFGSAVAARGELALAGAPGADFFAGRGLLYTRAAPGSAWEPAATLVEETTTTMAAVTGQETPCADSRAGGFPCRDVDLVGFLPTSALGAKRGIMLNDVWGWSDSTTNREFVIVGRMDGTAFVEVTDPTTPRYLGELPLHAGAQPNMWRDMKVYRNHAFIVSDGAGPHGVQIFDLTQLRDVQGAPRTFTETAHYDRIASAHNIAIDEESGFAYTIGNSMGGETCGGGPHMIDIRDPRKPTFAGCWADTTTGSARTGYTHDSQCTVYRGPDQRYRGRQLCFNASETALGIADVTDKSAPTRISSASYPNVSYAHQGWLSDDHRFFFLNDEGDELAGAAKTTRTLVFDLTDLEDPVVAKEFMGTTPATDHNLYVKGRYMYQSNYVAGLRVIDVNDPRNPVEVGYFDTVPGGTDAPGFAGAWSNYPYFRSGVVAVSSMQEGLFLVRYRPRAVVP